MPIMKIVVEHHFRQTVTLDVPEDELANMEYDDILCNAPFDELQTSDTYSEIIEVRVDGEKHYF